MAGLLKGLQEFRTRQLHNDRANAFAPIGHFYSPFPDLDAVRRNEARIFGSVPRELPGVNLREPDQVALLTTFARYYETQPFSASKQPGLRYYFENPFFSYGDALTLHCMLRHARPRRVVEVGSGFSSCVLLDTNAKFFDGALQCTFIEPYPDTLLGLLSDEDKRRVELHRECVQDARLDHFTQLAENDVLFIDSSHVSKIDSDVNHLLFEVLPRLKPGVFVHFHDIFYPFEYPREWIYEGRAWNEAYALRAFLSFNDAFEVVFFNSFMAQFHAAELETAMPLFLKNPGGSLWLRRSTR